MHNQTDAKKRDRTSPTDEQNAEPHGVEGATLSRGQEVFGTVSGLLFVALWISSLVLPGIVAPTGVRFPNPLFSSSEEILSYYSHAQTAGIVGSTLQLLAACALLGFSAYATVFVGHAAGKRGASILPWLALGGGVAAAILLALSSLLAWVLTQPDTVERADLVRAFYELIFVTGGAGHVAALGALVGAASIATWRTRALPGWVAWVGFVTAGLCLLSLATLIWLPASILILAGRIVAFVWVVAVSVMGLRATRRVAQGREVTRAPA